LNGDLMSKIRYFVILLGLLVVVAQVGEFLANNNLSDWEKKKEDIYNDYVRYLDIQTQALVLRSSYNTLQAVNNATLYEAMVEREKEMLDRLLASLLALTVHVEGIENKDEWEHMNYTELMDLSRQLSPIINNQYNDSKSEVNNWKQNVNIASTFKFSLLAFQVILVIFDKGKKR
jgi:hypothetical protein